MEKLQGKVGERDAHQGRGGGVLSSLGKIEVENGLISYRPAAVKNSAHEACSQVSFSEPFSKSSRILRELSCTTALRPLTHTHKYKHFVDKITRSSDDQEFCPCNPPALQYVASVLATY